MHDIHTLACLSTSLTTYSKVCDGGEPRIQARVAVEATTPQVALFFHEQEGLTPCVQVAFE